MVRLRQAYVVQHDAELGAGDTQQAGQVPCSSRGCRGQSDRTDRVRGVTDTGRHLFCEKPQRLVSWREWWTSCWRPGLTINFLMTLN